MNRYRELVKKKGYVAQTEYAVNIAEVDNQSLWHHSERLTLIWASDIPLWALIRIKKKS